MSELYPVINRAAHQLAVSTSIVRVPVSALDEYVSHVMLDFQGAAIRVTFDGSDPSPTRGVRYSPGNCPIWNRRFAEAAKFIREGSTDGSVHIQPLQQ